MCQLTFTNLNCTEFNKLYLMTQALTNTTRTHKDGFGFFTPERGIWKTHNAPTLLLNLGEIINREVVSPSPIISHVRLASTTNGKREISKENSHPFQTKNLILVHNGSLEFQDEETMKDKKYEGKIDSEIFLSRLDEIYTLNKRNLVKSIQETMDEFYGKFAFIIYEFSTKKYYIVRGFSAELHYYDVFLYPITGKEEDAKKIGFVINTEKDYLGDGLFYFNNYLQFSGHKIMLDSKKVSLLDRETIYILDKETDTLEKVGEIKENIKPVKVIQSTDTTWWNKNNNNQKAIIPIKDSAVQYAINFLEDYDLDIAYLDELFNTCIGEPISGASLDEINLMINEIIPLIKSKLQKNVVKEWKKIRANTMTYSLGIHQKHNLEFPYLLEDVKKLRSLRNELSLSNPKQ